MENENKCFFSISLENGIVITGENPYKVLDFLTELESSLYWASVHYAEVDQPGLQECAEIMLNNVSTATITISENINEEERVKK